MCGKDRKSSRIKCPWDPSKTHTMKMISDAEKIQILYCLREYNQNQHATLNPNLDLRLASD